MQRRGFIAAAVAAMVAPIAPEAHAHMPDGLVRLWGDGVHDDTAALQALITQGLPVFLRPGVYRLTKTFRVSPSQPSGRRARYFWRCSPGLSLASCRVRVRKDWTMAAVGIAANTPATQGCPFRAR